MTSSESSKAIQLQQLVRSRDYDRYLCALVAGNLSELLPVLAFHSEISPIAEIVQEPHIGAIRLKWWEEALDEIYGDAPVRQHEATQALADAVQLHSLPRALFDMMLHARALDLEWNKGSPDEESFIDYIDGTVGAYHQLLAHILDTEKANECRAQIGAMSRAYGVVGLLRALPYHVEQGLVKWPLPVLVEHGINPAAIERGEEAERLKAFVHYWTNWAEEQLPEDDLPSELKVLTLMHETPLAYLKRLKANGYQLSSLPLRIAHMPLRLWWKNLFL